MATFYKVLWHLAPGSLFPCSFLLHRSPPDQGSPWFFKHATTLSVVLPFALALPIVRIHSSPTCFFISFLKLLKYHPIRGIFPDYPVENNTPRSFSKLSFSSQTYHTQPLRLHYILYIFNFSKRFYLYILERGEGREKETVRNIDVQEKRRLIASRIQGGLACDPICPDQESNW